MFLTFFFIVLFLFFYRSHVRKELWKSGGLVGAHGRRWYEVSSHLIIVLHKNFEKVFFSKRSGEFDFGSVCIFIIAIFTNWQF